MNRTLYSFCVAAALLGAGNSHAAPPSAGKDYAALRNEMVDHEIAAAGVKNERVLKSMRDTPRHEFVAMGERANAYFDMALPIGESQTISPPFIVAYMTEQLDPQPDDKVLEVGTGSGYQAAILSPLVKDVYSIEIVKPLGERAAKTLKRLQYENVHTKIGDGYQGWEEFAPFDKIIVTCSPEKAPQALIDQLKEGGRMLVPVGERYQQSLYLFRKEKGELIREALLPVLFVPMTGAAEESREVQPDPTKPEIRNGGFEEISGANNAPDNWHYVRQMEIVGDGSAPQGKRYARFTNSQAGRGSQALEGMPIDGRKITDLHVTLSVRGKNILVGRTDKEQPILGFVFYDERRAIVGGSWLGPWKGTFDWKEVVDDIKVPPKTREAFVRIGLMGATGELDVDNIRIEPGFHKRRGAAQ